MQLLWLSSNWFPSFGNISLKLYSYDLISRFKNLKTRVRVSKLFLLTVEHSIKKVLFKPFFDSIHKGKINLKDHNSKWKWKSVYIQMIIEWLCKCFILLYEKKPSKSAKRSAKFQIRIISRFFRTFLILEHIFSTKMTQVFIGFFWEIKICAIFWKNKKIMGIFLT